SIVVLDFGAQYSQLIARRVRELGAYSLILPHRAGWGQIQAQNPAGIILSGGPSSVYAEDAPRCAPEIWTSGLPLLGICYGLQLMVHTLGGTVENADEREFGRTEAMLDPACPLFRGSDEREMVWMSHGDSAQKLPEGFRVAGRSRSALAAIENPERKMWAVQFHPEVRHTEHGDRFLGNFLAICGLSGGVDSTVAATLVHRAIGDRLTCVFVNNGLLRKDEFAKVQQSLRAKLGLNILAVDASEKFLSELAGITDPEQKRKIIGRVFIEVFEPEARKLGAEYLVQGTLYPDVIESVSVRGPSAVIKSHHNVGGLPADLRLKLV